MDCQPGRLWSPFSGRISALAATLAIHHSRRSGRQGSTAIARSSGHWIRNCPQAGISGLLKSERLGGSPAEGLCTISGSLDRSSPQQWCAHNNYRHITQGTISGCSQLAKVDDLKASLQEVVERNGIV